jgi:CDP-diacylglycerol--glycerol-3-phosphate 3-phosphatidyltransferase
MPNPAIKKSVRALVRPAGSLLARVGVSPDAVTFAGLAVAAACGYALARGEWGLAFALLLASGFCDLLDGAVARASGRSESKMGAALDSTIDRYSESLVLGGVLIDAVRRGAGDWLIWVWVLALTGSFLTSYVRARAEGLGIPCEVGIMERPERLALLALLCLLGPSAALWILAILALGSHVTFLQRLLHIQRLARSRERGAR